ncbi:hypothetical protein DFR68_102687 [Nocardia mexicana]|uniref:Uncharacterized protein n=1 Tax=Nocardia mexicana TaxID=279262 RepID=A0A370HCA8_9NOCA|nr:hypothetical protein DFR68_102687 [Nocardia mexicana]
MRLARDSSASPDPPAAVGVRQAAVPGRPAAHRLAAWPVAVPEVPGSEREPPVEPAREEPERVCSVRTAEPASDRWSAEERPGSDSRAVSAHLALAIPLRAHSVPATPGRDLRDSASARSCPTRESPTPGCRRRLQGSAPGPVPCAIRPGPSSLTAPDRHRVQCGGAPFRTLEEQVAELHPVPPSWIGRRAGNHPGAHGNSPTSSDDYPDCPQVAAVPIAGNPRQ